jgi:outer membrane protein assembly factor BamA
MKPIYAMALAMLAAPLACFAKPIENPHLITQAVRCRGNQATSCEFIRSHLYLHEGDAVSEDEIRNAELRLASLRNFDSVAIHLEKGAVRDSAVVVIDVTEASPIATELLVGASARLESIRQVIAGRIAHQNLFGTGKVADLTVLAVTPYGGDATQEDYDVTLRYADPNLFGMAKYFAIASVGWQNDHRRDVHGNFSNFEGAQLDVRVGRRFGDFSYITLGIAYRPNVDWIFGEWKRDGRFEIEQRDSDYGLSVIYGWNSEDDLYFPTTGSSFHIGAGWDFGSGSPENRSHIQYRKTWRLAHGLVALKIGGGPSPEYRTSFEESQLLALNYSRPLQTPHVTRGRWYVEPGFGWTGRDSQGDVIYEIGAKAGVRLELPGWGIIDLYVMGSRDPS